MKSLVGLTGNEVISDFHPLWFDVVIKSVLSFMSALDDIDLLLRTNKSVIAKSPAFLYTNTSSEYTKIGCVSVHSIELC